MDLGTTSDHLVEDPGKLRLNDSKISRIHITQFCNFINNLEEDIKFEYDTIGRISTLESRIKVHQKCDRKVKWIKPNNINSSR